MNQKAVLLSFFTGQANLRKVGGFAPLPAAMVALHSGAS